VNLGSGSRMGGGFSVFTGKAKCPHNPSRGFFAAHGSDPVSCIFWRRFFVKGRTSSTAQGVFIFDVFRGLGVLWFSLVFLFVFVFSADLLLFFAVFLLFFAVFFYWFALVFVGFSWFSLVFIGFRWSSSFLSLVFSWFVGF